MCKIFHLCSMFFKVSMRHNPHSGHSQGYYRLVESYRNACNRICHRTLLNIGFVDISPEQHNSIRGILNDRLNRRSSLFEEQDPHVLRLADQYWGQLVASGKIDASEQGFEKKQRMVDMDTLTHKDAREVGAEWMCFQGMEQLKINQFLESLNWDQQQIQLAITQIISRAVCPHSELRTSRWIRENSAVCEITGYPIDKITKDKLYKSALDLYAIKGPLELFLSKRTNELFDLQDRIIERYPSMAKHFVVQVKTEGDFASDITLMKKDSYAHNETHLGCYFIRTNLNVEKQQRQWDIYNTIREIESSFRCLKTELDLRPIYHKNDDATVAHIHLGLLAYWLVNTIRYQLKKKQITHCWKEILRITNTQKVITTYGQNTFDEVVSVRRCTEPQDKVKEIYQALGYRNYPFVKRKSVVHKPVLKKNQDTVLQ